MKLSNYVSGQWLEGSGPGTALVDPVTGEILATASSEGIDLAAGLQWARQTGGPALRALGYARRGELLGAIVEVLTAHRERYFEISLKNLGTTQTDASFDIDGALFTLKTYARAAKALGDGAWLREGAPVNVAKTEVFQGQHYLFPQTGVAVFINAFNFPAWGLWEKAAPALLSGMPVFVKPATPTAWLTQQMVADVIAAGILPAGALSILCGEPLDLLDHVNETDVVSFTGSAATARRIRSHPAVVANAVRVNVEADSVNAAILGPDAVPGSTEFDYAVKQIVTEYTIKAGQKCTAIRRILAPKAIAGALGEAVKAKLAALKVGNARNPEVRVGPLVNKAQQRAALEGLALLRQDCSVLHGDGPLTLIDADPAVSAFVAPTLLLCEKGLAATHVHDIEVFGPVATLIPYADTAEAIALARRGRGSLVASVYSADEAFTGELVPAIADLHGRVVVLDARTEGQHTGHGNVMPNCLHGGPGRAGGGEELGGLRALGLYHRRMVVQAPAPRIAALSARSSDAAPLVG